MCEDLFFYVCMHLRVVPYVIFSAATMTWVALYPVAAMALNSDVIYVNDANDNVSSGETDVGFGAGTSDAGNAFNTALGAYASSNVLGMANFAGGLRCRYIRAW